MTSELAADHVVEGAPGSSSRTLAGVAIAAMVVAAFLPWLRVSIDVLGVASPALAVKGTEVGSDLGVDYGYLLVGAAALAAVTLASRNRGALIAVSVAAVGLAGYAALTAQNHKPLVAVAANGQAVSARILAPHASLAYGVLVEAAASVVLLLAALSAPRTAPDLDAG